MAPPTAPLNLDVEAISGICGSISIACWVVVFSPQIVENFRRGNADGLSLQFIIVWLWGDVFNILGAVLQGVLPTMIILAIYYTLADVVLLGQCFYYRGFTWRDDVIPPSRRAPPKPANGHQGEPHERTGLLVGCGSGGLGGVHPDRSPYDADGSIHRRGSWSSQSHHLSPAVPLLDEGPATISASALATRRRQNTTRLQAVAFNMVAVFMVCASGVAGWYLSRPPLGSGRNDVGGGAVDGARSGGPLEFNLWGQAFGWLCALLYLGSRVPQLLLNWRRKSTEGVSVLFFLFACLGNLTYVLSIFAFDPRCQSNRRGNGSTPPSHPGLDHSPSPDEGSVCEPGEASHIYWQYILVNLSWLAGSLGTLLLDLSIFVQFFVYGKDDDHDEDDIGEDDADDDATADGQSIDEDRWDPRPILQRNTSNFSQ